MSRVSANISDNEDRLTLELVADLCKDYGAQWSDKKSTAKAAKEASNDAIGSAEGEKIGNRACQKRIRIEIELLEEGAFSCDCWMSDMVLATASSSAYIAAKVSAQYTSPLSRGCG
jgi:hypothetical protein